MSLEQALAANTAAVLALTEKLGAVNNAPIPHVAHTAAPVPQAAPPVFVPPAAAAVPVAQSFIPPTPPMPAPPTFAPAAPAPAALPFGDTPSLVTWATEMYHALTAIAPGKGDGIQAVMKHLGVNGLQEVRPDQYAQFHQMVESLRA